MNACVGKGANALPEGTLRQPSVGIGREQEVLGFPGQRLSEPQDVTAVVDGGRLRGTITVGCQVERSRIRAPPEKMSSVVTGGLVGSDDARSGIYSDRGAGEFQYYGSDAILEYSCHRSTICDGAPGRFAEAVYRIDKPTQILSRALAKDITAFARRTQTTGE